MGAGIARHTEYVSPLLAVADFIFPDSLSNLYLANTLDLEQLIALTLDIVSPDLDEVIGKSEWLHQAVSNVVTVCRLIVA